MDLPDAILPAVLARRAKAIHGTGDVKAARTALDELTRQSVQPGNHAGYAGRVAAESALMAARS